MRILVAHNFYQHPGGEDQCVAAETAMLQANGHQVIQFFLHNDAIDGMSPLKVAARATWSQSAYHEIRELIRAHHPQIVHFNNTLPLISPAAYYAAGAENVRVVQTLHNFRLLCLNACLYRDGGVCEECLGKSLAWPGVVHQCYRDSYRASAAVATMLGAHRALGTWRNAVDAYIALAEFSRKKFVQGGLPEEKIFVKPNFVYPDPGPGKGDGDYGIYVGRLSQEKGISTLLEAWAKLGGKVPLKIVGEGPMLATVSAVAKDPAIQWLGYRPPAEALELVGSAKFLVCPSECYENFPRVLVEAFAKATPVIASDLGAMAELVDHGRTGLRFPSGNSAALASTVEQLMAFEPERWKRMSLAARHEYENKYTAASNYPALMAIYERVLSRGGAS